MLIPHQPIKVCVTGNGPYPDGNGGHFDRNSSHLVSQLLPSLLPAKSDINPTGADIRILNPTAKDGCELKTEYRYIRSYLKELHDQNDDVDIFVHLGMAGGWDYVSIERMAFKQGMSSDWWSMTGGGPYYMVPDDIGETIEATGPCPWNGVPIGLSTAFHVDDLVEASNAILRSMSESRSCDDSCNAEKELVNGPPLPIKPHFEAGFYCCGFIYYESLANCYVRKRVPRVLFCHVPGELDEGSLHRAKDAVVAIIIAAVAQFIKTRLVSKPGEDGGSDDSGGYTV